MNSQTQQSVFDPLPWHGALWSEWLRQMDSKRLPHAVLVSGLPGLGKRQLAESFIHALLCRAQGVAKPCGDCKGCKLLAADSHPDFRDIGPEEPGKAIKIDQVRELVGFLSGTAQQGGWKCVIIEPADAMNNNAANALLKSLEEPPGDTLIILVSAMPSRLAATLRSRCQQVQVKAPSREEALAWLEPQVEGRAEALLDHAHGAPCAALRASQTERLSDRADILADLLKLAEGQASTVHTAKAMQGHSGLEAMDQFLALLHRLAKAQLAERASPDCIDAQWQGIIERMDNRLLFRFRDKLIHAKTLLLSGANPNKQLLWEELMFDWQALVSLNTSSPHFRACVRR